MCGLRRVRRRNRRDGEHRDRRRRVSALGRTRLRQDRLARHALLQQQLGRLDAGIGMKPLDEDVVAEHVGERDERHALVMGEEGAHHHRRPRRSSGARVDVARGAADSRATRRTRTVRRGLRSASRSKFCGGRRGIDERGERGGVRRDDEVVDEPALQARGPARRTPGIDSCRRDR